MASLPSTLVVSSKSNIISISRFFFFNDTATTEIYTLSLHDALPICGRHGQPLHRRRLDLGRAGGRDRSEEHTSELQSHLNLVCRLLLEKKKAPSDISSTILFHIILTVY